MSRADAWQAVAALAATQHGVFTTKQADDLGLSIKRISGARNAGQVRRAAHGVYAFTSSPPTHRQRLMVAHLLGAIASHGSAAHLHQLDGFAEPSRTDVSLPHGRTLTLPGVTVHTWRYESRDDITTVDGIRCTSVARTLVQLGAVADRDQVERALDSALRRGASLAWIRWTLERLHRPGVTGACVLRDVLDDPARVEGVESPLERDVVKALVGAGLPAPVTQFEVVTALGTFRADFAYPDLRLIIEAHSMAFHWDDGPNDRDMRRHLALAATGYEVVYLTAHMLNEPTRFLPLVEAAYQRALGQH